MRARILAIREWYRLSWAAVPLLVAIVSVGIGLFIWSGLPPRKIVIATGEEGGLYFELGKRFQTILARDNIDVELVPTSGSVANMTLLTDRTSPVSVSFVQSGIIPREQKTELESLGTMFYEPAWWFRRKGLTGAGVPSLLGRKIVVGAAGSGTRALSLQLLYGVGVNPGNSVFLDYSSRSVRAALASGEADVAFVVASFDSPIVKELLADDAVELVSYLRADALVALHPFLTKLRMPRGSADLVRDRPSQDIDLIAAKASLIVRKEVHPAIQYLLIQAAQELFWTPGIFRSANQFPAAEAIDVPLSSEARRFYRSGFPFFHGYLPFWVAELLGRLAVVLVPLLGVLIPATQLVPRIYNWALRSRVLRLYGELRFLEAELDRARREKQDPRAIISQIAELRKKATRLKFPLSFTSQTERMLAVLYEHIDAMFAATAARKTDDASSASSGRIP